MLYPFIYICSLLVYGMCSADSSFSFILVQENVANREEFDGDEDAGVYNPVVLPWKNR